MNNLLHNIDEDTDERPGHIRNGHGDREISLGTTTILLIFFALAVQDAAVFGFGYSIGGKRNPAPVAAPVQPTSLSYSGGVKPAPGNPFGSAASTPPAAVDSAAVPYTPPAASTTKTIPLPAPIERIAPDTTPAEESRTTLTRTAPDPAAAAPLPPLPPIAAPGTGTVVVQVAAVSHQEDAELISNSLRHRGYTVNIRNEPDHLLHVQVGPFTNRKDAEAMKARLLADGFNAYIK